MGVLKFRLSPPELATKVPDLRKAYVTGIDRTACRTSVDLRGGLLSCLRETGESGRVHVPWPVAGYGEPMVSTATLAERAQPYDLGIELARGKLNDVQNQLADWRQMGLLVPMEVEDALSHARKACARAVTARDNPGEGATAAALSLEASFLAARHLVDSYTSQLIRRRLDHSRPLPTLLACGVEGLSKSSTWAAQVAKTFQAGRVGMTWSKLSPDEGKRRWDDYDSQVNWCRKNNLQVTAGPLLDLHRGSLPDWLWLWEGDYEEIQEQATEHVRQTITRYRGKIATWHVVHRAASSEILGLSEEEQIKLTAHLLRVANRLDPDALMVVDFDRPWGEWMASSRFQLGPLHLADSLARAELGMSGIGLEIAPGYSRIGSHLRDLLDFSRLLDLYALVNLPVHISMALPSGTPPGTNGPNAIGVETVQFARTPDEAFQKQMMEAWFSLAVAKPFVRSVTWIQALDDIDPTYPQSGLFRTDGTAKPSFEWLKQFGGRISAPAAR